MHRYLLHFVIPGVVISLLTTGCILSKSVDRTFLGYTKNPAYREHKVAGYILMPVAFAADLVTFPIQAVLLAIFGDNFPFEDERAAADLDHELLFQKLTDEQKSGARAEFTRLLQSGAASANRGLVLCDDGHWEVVNLDPEVREKLTARANDPAP